MWGEPGLRWFLAGGVFPAGCGAVPCGAVPCGAVSREAVLRKAMPGGAAPFQNSRRVPLELIAAVRVLRKDLGGRRH